jgi:hypothetical protein
MSGAVSMATVASVAGMGMSAYGAYSNSKSSKAAYGAQAQVNRNNAQIAGWQAEDALKRGDKDAMRVKTKANRLKGAQRAGFGANGVDMSTGSALQILSDTEYFGEVDATTVKNNAEKEAWALRNQAMGFNADASLLQGRADSEKPLAAAAGSLLTSASKVSSQWGSGSSGGYRYKVPTYDGAEY